MSMSRYLNQIEELKFRLEDLVLENSDREEDHEAASAMLRRIEDNTFRGPIDAAEVRCFQEECNNQLDILTELRDDMKGAKDFDLDEILAEIKKMKQFKKLKGADC